MLNDIWNGLVTKVDTAKSRYSELETAVMVANDCLNDGITAIVG